MKTEVSSLQDDIDFNILQQLRYRFDTDEDVRKDKLYLHKRIVDQGNMLMYSQIFEPMINTSFVANCNETKSKLQKIYASIVTVDKEFEKWHAIHASMGDVGDMFAWVTC